MIPNRSRFANVRPAALLSAALLPLGLAMTGCTAGAQSDMPAFECESSVESDPVLDSVAVSGQFGNAITLNPTGDMTVDHLVAHRQGEGDGRLVTERGVIDANYTIVDMSNGAVLAPYRPFTITADENSAATTMDAIAAQLPGIASAMQCAREGQRVIAAMPMSTLFGDESGTSLPVDTSVVVGVDIVRVYSSSASGVVSMPKDGFPAVVTAPDGRPGVTMPKAPAPANERAWMRITGHGPTVAAGEQATIHMSIFDWESGEELASTWDARNSVIRVPIDPNNDGIYGLTKHLEGQPTGSQLVAVVPAARVAEAQGPLHPQLVAGRTLVVVVDVLGTDGAA